MASGQVRLEYWASVQQDCDFALFAGVMSTEKCEDSTRISSYSGVGALLFQENPFLALEGGLRPLG